MHLNPGVVLILDNTTLHKSNPVKTVTDRYNCEILPHPSYSPHLSPCNYDLFPKLKISLQGVRFEDLYEHVVAVAMELHRITLGCLATGIMDLPKRLNAVIQQRGHAKVRPNCFCDRKILSKYQRNQQNKSCT